eukprot:4447215-Amphidinium_carterae.1
MGAPPDYKLTATPRHRDLPKWETQEMQMQGHSEQCGYNFCSMFKATNLRVTCPGQKIFEECGCVAATGVCVVNH